MYNGLSLKKIAYFCTKISSVSYDTIFIGNDMPRVGVGRSEGP